MFWVCRKQGHLSSSALMAARQEPTPPTRSPSSARPGAFQSSGLVRLTGGAVEIWDVSAPYGGQICLWAVVRLEALAAHRSSWKPLISAAGAVDAWKGVHVGGGRLQITNASATEEGGADGGSAALVSAVLGETFRAGCDCLGFSPKSLGRRVPTAPNSLQQLRIQRVFQGFGLGYLPGTL